MVKLLIVEDDRAIRYVLERSLEALAATKFEIESAANGDEAVRRMLANGIDVMVTDIRMPVMDGIEAIRRIREFSQVPIIVLSAYSDDKTIKASYAAGANRFFAKPPDLYKLASTIIRLARPAVKRSPELIEKQRRLAQLRVQAARMGNDTPPHILTEIEDIQAELNEK